jgi:asparagine synthetase B (glutamine-hydrolysing)
MRLPFLDEDVVSLAVNLPLASLRRGQTVKYPLRQAMQGVVPERIRNRPKEFFGRSFLDASQKWPRDSEWFRHYLLESEFTSLGLVSKKYLQSKYDRVIQDNIGFETFLWKQVFAAVWFDNVLAMQTP